MNLFKNIFAKGIVGLSLLGSLMPQAFAHPGHELLEHGPRHTLTSPDHLLVVAVSGMLLVGCGIVAKKQSVRRALVASGSLALAAAALLWSIG
ncbi:MAG: hypothetical protein ACO1QB_11210 [Verrucomicrobiales bacterium]